MSEYDLETIEIDIATAKKMIGRMEILRRLQKNSDFKELISEGYLEKEPARIVLAKADDSMATPEYQDKFANMLIAVGYFNQYLLGIQQLGLRAQRDLTTYEETQAEMLEES